MDEQDTKEFDRQFPEPTSVHKHRVGRVDAMTIWQAACEYKNTQLAAKDAKITELQNVLKGMKQNHRYCDDPWYSCPKHPDGCANAAEGTGCTCGADEANTAIDNVLAIPNDDSALQEALKQAKREAFSAGQAEMRERAANTIDDGWSHKHVAAAIRALPIGENE